MYENKTRNKKIIFGVLLVVFGIFVISIDYLKEKKNRAFEIINFEFYNVEEKEEAGTVENDELEDIEVPEESKPIEPEIIPPSNNQQTESVPVYHYIGILEIPKINLKKGFVDPNSIHNNVDENITIINTSTFPNVEKGNFILAAHSGTGYISYFKNLYQLTINDYAYIYYQNIKYTYKIVNIYKEPKIGKIPIYRDFNETTLTLITCTKNDESTQTVYIANLVEKTNY